MTTIEAQPVPFVVRSARFDEHGYCEAGRFTLFRRESMETEVWLWESNEPVLIGTVPPLTAAEKAQAWICVDESGDDLDTIVVRGKGGTAEVVLIAEIAISDLRGGKVALVDGTVVSKDDIQLAFQNALIAKTGMCVLEHEYMRAGFPDLASLAAGARS